tara:strand:- start:462 stop:605 length:144 start_codon:yes stop_codon:yes gene_type:complete
MQRRESADSLEKKAGGFKISKSSNARDAEHRAGGNHCVNLLAKQASS